MAVPAGGEIAIYNAANKTLDYRILLGLDYPARTATFQDLFGAALDPEFWAYSEYGGPPPVAGGILPIQILNGPPRMWAQTRPNCFPDDPTEPFEIEINMIFPQEDPVFSAVVTIGTIDNTSGQDEEPFRIAQHGSTRWQQIGSANIGEIFYSYAAAFPASIANDGLTHKYWLRWDGAGNIAIEVDDVEIYNDPGPRPYYVRFGMELPQEDLAIATAGRVDASLTPSSAATVLLGGGTTSAPTAINLIEVQDITITPDANETRTYPAWTFANLGGDLTTAIEGERFSLDGETWAKVPKAHVVSFDTGDGLNSEQISDEMVLTLHVPHPEFPETTPNRFLGDRLVNRHIILDTRTGQDDGSLAAWKRQFVGIVTRSRLSGDLLTLDARDRLTDRLDAFLPRAFLSVVDDTTVRSGPHDAWGTDMEISGPDSGGLATSILTDLIRVSDGLAGGAIGAASYQARLLDHKPVSLSSGGASLLPVFQEIVDRCGLEWWRKYRTTGAEAYGQHMIAARTVSGSPGYTFRGLDASGGNSNISYPPGVTVEETRGDGVGQMYMRNDSPSVREVTRNIEHLPILGIFPSAGAYPPHDRVWADSFAALSGFGLSTLLTLKDHANNNVPGGVAYLRYRAENMERRKVEFECVGHDWIEPTDIIDIDDARSGLLTGQAILVTGRTLSYRAGGNLVARVRGVFLDYVESIRRTI